MVSKMILTVLGVIAVASTLEANMNIDYKYYCRPELDCLKKPARSHVMCSYPANWTANCLSPRFIPMTDARKQLFLDGHNSRRNLLALGKLPGIFAGRQAVDMAEMVWDDELEMIAQKNLITCEQEHDKCRRTKKYIWAGQNLAERCKEPFLTPEEAIEWANQGWWAEYKDINFIDGSNNYSSIKASDQYGHFTQMGRDKAFAIGCAVTSTEDDFCHNIACNYAVTNWGLDPVYAMGRVRSKCKTFSQKYPGLCSDREDYTNYVRFGVSFFTKDDSPVPPLQQWIANGRILTAGTVSKRQTNLEQKTMKPTSFSMPATPISGVKSTTFNVPSVPNLKRKSMEPTSFSMPAAPFSSAKFTNVPMSPHNTMTQTSVTNMPPAKRRKIMTTVTSAKAQSQVPSMNSIQKPMPRVTSVKRSVPVTTRTYTTTSTTVRRPQVVGSKVSLGSFQVNNMDNMEQILAEVKRRLGQNVNMDTIKAQLSKMNVQLGDGFNKIGQGNVKRIRISGSYRIGSDNR